MARRTHPQAIPTRASRWASQAAEGFTLTELLISLVLGGVLMAAAASTVVSQIRSGNSMEIAQSLRNDMGRLTTFLDSEIGEGDTISYFVPLTGPDGCGVGGTSLFTINVPNLGGTGTTLTTTPIHYYLSGIGNTAALNRCGPPINANGSLNFGGTRIATPVSPNTTLTLTNTTDTKAVNFSLTLRDANAANPLARTGLSSKTRVTLIN
jgi:prepilin-type N-terminal cleavage/methylation domain-containing protein